MPTMEHCGLHAITFSAVLVTLCACFIWTGHALFMSCFLKVELLRKSPFPMDGHNYYKVKPYNPSM